METVRKNRYFQRKLLLLLLPLFLIIYQSRQEEKPEREVQKLSNTYRFLWEDYDDISSFAEGGEKAYNLPNLTDQSYDGEIDCILEIPSIDLCRVVITGGDRQQNLDRHYFVAARETMRYGQGSYVIYGHQSFIRGKGFNRLDELEPGDSIYIITESGRTLYCVTEVMPSHWGEAAEDFSGDEDHLAIYTCKKQTEYPKPYMIVRAEKNP